MRYERIVRAIDPGQEIKSSYVATVTYRFVETPMKESERLINPRGFTVTNYRVDEETIR